MGEIALRVNDLDLMQESYEKVIGLELMQRFPKVAFFKIAEGYAGHTQILALFDRKEQAGFQGLSAAQTTVDHFAFTIALSDYEAEKAVGSVGAEGQCGGARLGSVAFAVCP